MQGDLFTNESVLLFPVERMLGVIENTAQLMACSAAERGARAQLSRSVARIDIMCLEAGLDRSQREEQIVVFRDAVVKRLAELCPQEPKRPSAEVVSLESYRQARG